MASIEDRLTQVEHALTRMGQMQEQGQVRLEQALKQAEGLIGSAGEAVAGAMEASAEQAAQAHLAALMRVVDEVATASKGTVAEASKAIQELRQSIQAEVQASQGVLKTVNAEADKASMLLKRMGEQGEKGEETLKAIHAELAAMRESVGSHKIQLKDAIKQAEAEAVSELKRLKYEVKEALPGYLLWLRQWFSIGVMAGIAVVSVLLSLVIVEKYKEHAIRTEVVQSLDAAGKFWIYNETKVSGGEKTGQMKWDDLKTPIMRVGKGIYVEMYPDGQGGWTHPEAPGKVVNDARTATVYRDKTRKDQLSE